MGWHNSHKSGYRNNRGTYEKIQEIPNHKDKHINNNKAKTGNVKRDSKQTNRKTNKEKSKTQEKSKALQSNRILNQIRGKARKENIHNCTKMIKSQETYILVIIQHSKIKFNYKQSVSYEMSTKAQNARSVRAIHITHIKLYIIIIIITVIGLCDLKLAINKKKYEYLKWIIWSSMPRKVYSTECDKLSLIICYTLCYITLSIQYCMLSIICIYWWIQVENCRVQYQDMFRKFDCFMNQLTWRKKKEMFLIYSIALCMALKGKNSNNNLTQAAGLCTRLRNIQDL